MKHLLKITSAVLVLLLCALGGVFLWRSGFFAALSSQQALRGLYLSVRSLLPPLFFPAPVPVCGAGPHPQQPQRRRPAGCSSAPGPPFFLPSPRSSPPPCWSFSWHARSANLLPDRLVSRAISDKYLSIVRAKTDTFLILAFLLPFFPDDLLCILAGLTAISTPRFLVIVVLTRPWGLLVCQRLGRCHPDSPSLGYGPAGDHRCGRLPAGDEIRRPLGGVHPEKIPSYKGR